MGKIANIVLSLRSLECFDTLPYLNKNNIYENEDKSFSVWKDGRTLKFEKEVMELYKDYKLRKSFEDLVSPLIKDGIDDLAIKEYGKEDYLCQITKDEKDWLNFEDPIPEDWTW